MSRLNWGLLGFAILFLMLWSGYSLTRIELKAEDKKMRVVEDGQLDIDLSLSTAKNKSLAIKILRSPRHGALHQNGSIFKRDLY